MASFGNYLLHNLFGNWNAGTWNVLPAVLTTWSNLLNTQGKINYCQMMLPNILIQEELGGI